MSKIVNIFSEELREARAKLKDLVKAAKDAGDAESDEIRKLRKRIGDLEKKSGGLPKGTVKGKRQVFDFRGDKDD